MRIFSTYLVVLTYLFHPYVIQPTPEDPHLTFEHLYQYGKDEYTRGNWQDCVAFLLRALDDYNYFRDETLWCREHCGKLKLNLHDLKGEDGESDWMTSRVMFSEAQRSLCLMKCQQDKFTSERPILTSRDVFDEFRQRRPFHYLQFCYWKIDDLSNAVKSAYTYLLANPKHKDTLENLNFYMDQDGFERKIMLVDTLQRPFERLYMEGVDFYDTGDWPSEAFERSLEDFLNEKKKCRLLCEDHLDWSSVDSANPELSIVLTSFYTSFVRCRYRCVEDLSRINGRVVDHFLASYFEYLHVCQFRASRGRDACISVANSILLNPSNILVRRNKLFYLKSYEKPELFEPTPEILQVHRTMELERRFLEFIDQKFQYIDKQLSPSHVEDRQLMNTRIDITDHFDYSKLEQPLIEINECKQLEYSASIPIPQRHFPFTNALVEELATRITNTYGTPPLFNRVVCAKTGSTEASGCHRGALIVDVGTKGDQCGAILADHFSGCAVVFCVA